jgi:hypothetical protein
MTSSGFFKDRDKRRAAALSLLFHLVALLLFIFLISRPDRVAPERYIVIDVGTPAFSEEVTDAPTVDDPAPQAQQPEVADSELGAPQPLAQEVEEPTPDPIAQEEQRVAPDAAQEEAEPEPVEELAAEPEPVEEVEEVADEPTPVAEAEPEEVVEEVADEPEALAEAAPEPEATQAETPPELAEPTPDAVTPEAPEAVAEDAPIESEVDLTTVLPEIDEVVLEPRPEPQPIVIPEPAVTVEALVARLITPTPSVEVASERAIPQPQIEAAVAIERAIPRPNVEVQTPLERPIPRPTVETEVTAPRPVPQPEVQASVDMPRAIPRPEIRSEVQAPRAVPQPDVQASVAQARAVPIPQVEAAVAAPRPVPQPSASVAVATPQPVPTPSVSASVSVPEAPAEVPVEAGGAPRTAVSEIEGGLETPLDPGGSADQAGQTRVDDDADLAGLGAAAGPDGSDEPTGAPAAPLEPFADQRNRPLAVLLDNANGYPQLGFREASAIYELPVEGGLTRLMTVYDRVDPTRVGPIRSARDYFVALAQNMDGILVHDGGAPSAIAAIQRVNAPTLNSFTSGELFARDTSRNAPYNLFSSGSALRSAVARLQLNRTQLVRGQIYRPSEEASDVERISVRYSGAYSSGFEYVPQLNLYRWQRNGTGASDAEGEAVMVNAVVVARINVQPIPGDPEGRLYIPLEGGPATLFVRGKQIEGRWSEQRGFQFFTSDGELVDLRAFKYWVVFAPNEANVTVQ